VIRYEHPLNERVRTLMRLEDLFARVGYFAAQDAAPDHHSALLALSYHRRRRTRDLKTDILQELGRQRADSGPVETQPQIGRTLQELLAQIDHVNARCLRRRAASARTCAGRWLMAIKQRTAIPGGVCGSNTGHHCG
jgi:cell division protein ZapD